MVLSCACIEILPDGIIVGLYSVKLLRYCQMVLSCACILLKC